MNARRIVKGACLFAGAVALSIGSSAIAQENFGTQSIGKMEFQKNCAACHGPGGKGDGPFVEFLKQTPPDLTMLSKRYGGIYPQERVYAWIRDAERVRAHGTSDMPVWGDRYAAEIIQQYGPDYTGPGSSVNERILELVFYLGSIQE